MGNEKRLIDAHALVQDHCEGCNALRDGLCYPFEDPVCGAVQTVLEAPTIDAVEVVRCKECKRYGGITFGRTCRMFSGMNTRIEMPEHGFCSHGERRTDGKEA